MSSFLARVLLSVILLGVLPDCSETYQTTPGFPKLLHRVHMGGILDNSIDITPDICGAVLKSIVR